MGLKTILKQAAAALPVSWQQGLKRRHFAKLIRSGRFVHTEPEFALLSQYLKPGDWALDVGANVGVYSARMSQLVGPEGRVLAFEPMPETFELLAADALLFPHRNVSLFNVALGEEFSTVKIAAPSDASGVTNYYRAQIGGNGSGTSIVTLALDRLALPYPVRLVKIDVEGFELPVLRGMRGLLERDHPVVIVETENAETVTLLQSLGYTTRRLPGSPNVLAEPQ